mmetsp:Transcript_42091/g.120824  ORF Transcript_42091/g.120824 Transcript_42091/m.120824 type:complete len:289 (+) Transcript_42091:4704-5570(+)
MDGSYRGLRHSKGRAIPHHRGSHSGHGSESVLDPYIDRIFFQYFDQWPNWHCQDSVDPGHAVVGILARSLQLDRLRLFGADHSEPDAGRGRRQAGQEEEGHLRPPAREEDARLHRRSEHALQGDVRCAAPDRDPAADVHPDSLRLRVVRPEGLGVPQLGRHQHARGHVSTRGRQERRHGPVLPPLQLGLRHAIRRREPQQDLHHRGQQVLVRHAPRRRRGGSFRRLRHAGGVQHGPEGDAADAGEVPLHVQHARRRQGLPGYLPVHARVSSEGGRPRQGLGARVRACI